MNTVCPGIIDTPMMQRFTGTSDGVAQVISQEPIGRMGKPEKIAEALLGSVRVLPPSSSGTPWSSTAVGQSRI